MMRGKIVMIEDQNGFGFIWGEWQSVYFDRSVVEADDFHRLAVGSVVEYELTEDTASDCGVPQAQLVRLKY